MGCRDVLSLCKDMTWISGQHIIMMYVPSHESFYSISKLLSLESWLSSAHNICLLFLVHESQKITWDLMISLYRYNGLGMRTNSVKKKVHNLNQIMRLFNN